PIEGMPDDGIEIVEPGFPAQHREHLVRPGDERRRIAGAARLHLHDERAAGDPLHALDDLAHAVAVPVADVQGDRWPPVLEVGEGIEMSGGQVFNMDVVAHPGSVWRVVVGTEDRYMRALADRPLCRHFDQQGGTPGRLTDATLRIRACDIEVAEG